MQRHVTAQGPILSQVLSLNTRRRPCVRARWPSSAVLAWHPSRPSPLRCLVSGPSARGTRCLKGHAGDTAGGAAPCGRCLTLRSASGACGSYLPASSGSLPAVHATSPTLNSMVSCDMPSACPTVGCLSPPWSSWVLIEASPYPAHADPGRARPLHSSGPSDKPRPGIF
jgi:hypothetical protein